MVAPVGREEEEIDFFFPVLCRRFRRRSPYPRSPSPGLAPAVAANTAVFVLGIKVLLKGLTWPGVVNSWFLGTVSALASRPTRGLHTKSLSYDYAHEANNFFFFAFAFAFLHKHTGGGTRLALAERDERSHTNTDTSDQRRKPGVRAVRQGRAWSNTKTLSLTKHTPIPPANTAASSPPRIQSCLLYPRTPSRRSRSHCLRCLTVSTVSHSPPTPPSRAHAARATRDFDRRCLERSGRGDTPWCACTLSSEAR